MKFSIDKKVFEKFPNFMVGVVVGRNINNQGQSEEIGNLLDLAVQKVKEQLPTDEVINSNPSITVWRNAFLSLGWNPKDIKASIDAMVSRIAKGNAFPKINKIVDLSNSAALEFLLPVGAHDVDRMVGEIKIRFSKEGDIFTPMGHLENETVPLGEIVYADDAEVRTRRWVWRQGDKAKMFPDTKTVFFPIDGFQNINGDKVLEAREKLAVLVVKLLGGEAQQFLVTKDNPETANF